MQNDEGTNYENLQIKEKHPEAPRSLRVHTHMNLCIFMQILF